ncbi:MAG TPA: PaaI family thioesterase [Bryobacteraceae bacterium]|nr:PaaI family thioesterase [Bryobacteraceae bacterium]
MPKLPDLYRERLTATGPWGLAATLGMKIDHFEPGLARVSMEATPAMHNPVGTVHGGVYCDLADMAMGIAFFCMLGEDEAMTTIELKINFLRPWVAGPMTAEARVVAKGKTTGVVECDVRDAQNRLIARASSTCYVLSGERAGAALRAMASWR